MKCPHCLNGIHENLHLRDITSDVSGDWSTSTQICPECHKAIIFLLLRIYANGSYSEKSNVLVYPRGISRSPCPKEVPEKFANDYKEACLVLVDSPKASAALSRRCLQNTLEEVENVKKEDLSKEIQEVLDKGKLPSAISEGLDAVRNIGNFAAHPIKSKSSGEIIDVEPGEAEWNLDVIESLFDYYFVQPEILKKKKAALDVKLKDAGKPPVK